MEGLETNRIYHGDCLSILKTLPDNSIDCCVTSPPYYGLRDYGVNGQIGLEETPQEYINKLVQVFHEVKRILKIEGTLWLNIGDSYCGSGNKEIKHKDLIGIPWMLAFALRTDGWYLRQDIIWHKPNAMPESVKDRCTKSHEYIFLLSKSPKYYFDYQAIQEEAKYKDDSRAEEGRIEYDGKRSKGLDKHVQNGFYGFQKKTVNIRFGGSKYGDNYDPHYATKSGNAWTPQTKYKNLQYDGQTNNTMHERRAEGLEDETYIVRNKRDVWSVTTKPFKEAHFATFPEDLIEPCILAGCREGGVVLDPFFGSGTTGKVADSFNRKWIGIELNEEYINIAYKRINNIQTRLFI